MRTILVTRPDAGTLFGGDLVHAEELAAALTQLGHEATLVSGPQDASVYAAYDVAHFFNLHTPRFTQPEMVKAKAAGTRLVLSPIFWDARAEWLMALSPTWGRLRGVLGPRLALALARVRVRAATRSWAALNRSALGLADLVMPSGESEIGQLRRLRSSLPPTVVVPLGVRPEAFDPEAAHPFPAALASRGVAEYTLVAARVDRHKNQAGLMRALEGTDIPVVLAGEIVDAEVGQECASRGALLLGRVPREALLALYRHARVHALPSFYDVPGLASLEAAAMGCGIVSTAMGTARDYFGDRALYCDPGELDSIRRSIRQAWEIGPDPSLSPYVREIYTWARAGQATATAYEAALSRRA